MSTGSGRDGRRLAVNRSGLLAAGACVALACGSLPAGSAPDQDAAAFAIMGRVLTLTDQGERAASPLEALDLYEEARRRLEVIPEAYPASRAAASLVLGDPLEQRLDADIEQAKRSVEAWKKAFAAEIDRDFAELE